MQSTDLNTKGVYVKDIQAASSLIAIGARLRDQMAVTVVDKAPSREILFWFQEHELEIAGVNLPVRGWLELLTCPWPAFKMARAGRELTREELLDHPVAYLKAAGENRKNLIPAVKRAEEKPFRVVQRGNRVVVVGANVTEDQIRRLLTA